MTDTLPGTASEVSAGRARPGGLLLRMLPAGAYAGRARTLVERNLLVHRRFWLNFVAGLGEPLFYLVAVGVGFGKLAGDLTGPGGAPISYAAFVAPGLLAASAMNGAIYDATIGVFFKIKYHRTFEAMLATPVGPVDLALGEVSWALLRGGLYASGFVTVMLAMGLVTSWWGLLILPAALFTAFGFAAFGMACATFMRSWRDVELVQLLLLPMFLFSTTFFPITVYPPAIRIVVEILPLYQGIEIMRALTTGVVGWPMLGHVAYFAVLAATGMVVTARRFGRLLLK
jgi:lipooligosaccharide transport system permease protein